MAADDDYGFRFTAMASMCEVRIGALGRRRAAALAAQAIAEVRRIETKYSRYRADSVVSRINASAGSGCVVAVDEETARLLDFAAGLWAESDGLFDITSGTLRKAWDFRARRMPAPGELEALLRLVGWSRVRWSGEAIALPLAGMEIDFGGFGKEYAADRAAMSPPRLTRPDRTPSRSASRIRVTRRGCSRGCRSATARSRPAATTSGTSIATAGAIATSSIRAPAGRSRTGAR